MSVETKVDSIETKLDEIPPAWSQILPAADRFKLVMGSAAVLDRETGLVWEQSPSTSTFTWNNAEASLHSNQLAVGNRKGWRLPTIQELASLIDPSVAAPGPTLPAGHPFSNVQSSDYWSANTSSGATDVAWVVNFSVGRVNFSVKSTSGVRIWCVRGGQGVDPQ